MKISNETQPSLREHLGWQMRSAYRGLARAIEGLEEAQAREGARADWRRYQWGSGLDGSIAGMVWHVALWKHSFAQGLETGAFPAEETIQPPDTDWPALQEWLADGQARLERAFGSLSETELLLEREWAGVRAPLARLLSYVIEHDLYHSGQVELLRQLRGYPSGADQAA
jgi:uncharacterized damage-inducible protein DinB